MENLVFEKSNINTYFKNIPLNEVEVNLLKNLFNMVPELYFMNITPDGISESLKMFKEIREVLPSESFAKYLDNYLVLNLISSDIDLFTHIIYIKEEDRKEYNEFTILNQDRTRFCKFQKKLGFLDWKHLIEEAKNKCELVIDYLNVIDTSHKERNYEHFIKYNDSLNYNGKLIHLASLLLDINLNLTSKKLSEMCVAKIKYINTKTIKLATLDASIRNIRSKKYNNQEYNYNNQLEELKEIFT